MDEIPDAVPRNRLRLCALMLQHYQTARPSLRIAHKDFPEYSVNEIHRTFHHLRALRWLEATLTFDADGRHFSGLVVQLTPLGRAAVRALSVEAGFAATE
ncbi:hypothetical protein C7E17_00070 [Stenotrophomonas maltophilia]|nr:hypothetical protein C7E17_00070 [Stenotrophomonas maltophilia]PSD48056.1 hypothetical protein C7E24_01275 [Stenotrophomonas maltophilia]